MRVREANNNSQKKALVLDALFPILTRCLGIFSNKYVYYITLVIFWSWMLIFFSLLGNGLKEFNAEYWLTYGFILIPCLELEIQLGVCLMSYRNWKLLRESYVYELPWDLTELSPQCRDEVRKLSKQVDVIFVLVCVLQQLNTVVVQIELLSHFMDFLFTTVSFTGKLSNIPACRIVIASGIFINIQIMAQFMIIAVYYSYYFTALTRIQFIILDSLIIDFRENGTKYDDRGVRDKLKSLIKRHQTILRLFTVARQTSFIPHVLMTICIFLAGISGVLMLYSPYYDADFIIYNMMTLLLLAFYFSHEGQLFDDLNENLNRLLYDLNWYDWDVGNLKTFRLFLLGTTINLQQRAVSLTRINHEYFSQIIRFVYTVANLARTMSTR